MKNGIVLDGVSYELVEGRCPECCFISTDLCGDNKCCPTEIFPGASHQVFKKVEDKKTCYVKKFVSDNLGKIVPIKGGDKSGMVVGYRNSRKEPDTAVYVIVSFTDGASGWHDVGDEDVLLISSPLSQSFLYINIYDLREA